MKSFKYFLALPLLFSTLVGCGSKDNFSVISYEKAKEIADNYVDSIKSNKASSITVGGHVNSITVKGDATWWSFKEPTLITPEKRPDAKVTGASSGEVAKKKYSGNNLLSMIPNFSITDSELKVDPHDIVSTTLPGSLMSVVEDVMKTSNVAKGFMILANLPKFPMNHNLLKFVTGYTYEGKEPKDKDGNTDWDKIEQKDWDEAEVKCYTANGRLKVSVETKDFEAFYNGIKKRFNPDFKPEPHGDKTYPASFYITTNKIGYVDSLGVNFEVADIDIEEENADRYYLKLKGNLEMDLALTFKQDISRPVTIKYQVTPYHVTDFTKGEKVDAEYNYGKEGKIPLTKEEIVGPDTDLTKFEKYVKFDWLSNIENDRDKSYKALKNIYDDPIFNFNYWKDNPKNIAFLDEVYDIVVIPAYSVKDGEYTQKYQILGANKGKSALSLLTTSVDGRVVSTNRGIKDETDKLLEAAGDGIIEEVCVELDPETRQPILASKLDLTEIYINANMFTSKDSEYIVNIPVLLLQEGE